MTNKEFIQKIDNGEAKVLTVEAAKQLKGKRILYFYFAYNINKETVKELVVGDVVSEWDFYKTQPCPGYSNRTEMWEETLEEERIEEHKNRLLLLSAEGDCLNAEDETFCIYSDSEFFDEPTFCCTDSDVEVYYLAL